MPIVPDLSGIGTLDPRLGGTYDLPILKWRGAQQVIVVGAASVQSTAFANTARALRIAPDGNIHWETGVNPVADTNSPFLAANAVEDISIKAGEKIAIVQDALSTGNVSLTEDG